ncbi:hypothetical protein ANRL1_04806 [Anaerolineae bacterium]|nr:hypothetical protein ANRL1_04806 [Anaerolineae bacterium]
MTQPQLAGELTLDSQVSDAIQAFAQILADTPEFQTFEENYREFKHDRAAQEAVRVFQEKQRSLQMMQQLGMLEQPELDELKHLREAMMNQPRVQAYLDAQNALMLLCQSVAQELSAAIGLDFANACTASCCG